MLSLLSKIQLTFKITTPYTRGNRHQTTGRDRKSKLCRRSMATCSSIPHLIVVFNYGDAMMPLDMLQTKGTWYCDWQDRLLASPIVHAGTNITLKSNESDWHPSPWLLWQLFLKWTFWRSSNLHNSTDFNHSEWSMGSYVDEPPNKIISFSYSHTNETPFLLPHHATEI